MSAATNPDDLVVATDWLATTVRAFLSANKVPYELPELAYCDAMRTMRLAGWPVERTLAYCKRVTTVQARSIPHGERIPERRDWLAAHMTQWLLACYYDSSATQFGPRLGPRLDSVWDRSWKFA